MTEIPTMECERCDGTGIARRVEEGWGVVRERCYVCDGTGRVQRPPLTPEQVAALPDGARVVVVVANHVDYPAWRGRVSLGSRHGSDVEIPQPDGTTVCLAADECRVWIADDGGEG